MKDRIGGLVAVALLLAAICGLSRRVRDLELIQDGHLVDHELAAR